MDEQALLNHESTGNTSKEYQQPFLCTTWKLEKIPPPTQCVKRSFSAALADGVPKDRDQPSPKKKARL
jgi:hypothetical protein